MANHLNRLYNVTILLRASKRFYLILFVDLVIINICSNTQKRMDMSDVVLGAIIMPEGATDACVPVGSTLFRSGVEASH